MTVYDLLMISVMLIGGVVGAWKGITLQLATIGSLAAGYLVAWPLSATLAEKFPGPPGMARGLALMVSYAAVSAAVFFAAQIIRTIIKRAGMGSYDRHLGMMTGAFSGAALVLAGTLAFVAAVPEARAGVWDTTTGRVAGLVWAEIRPAVPEDVRAKVEPLLEAESEPKPSATASFFSRKGELSHARPTANPGRR